MNKLFGIIVLIIMFLIIVHYIKFTEYKNNYGSIQIDKPLSDYSKYISENYPIVFLNMDLDKLKQQSLNYLFKKIILAKNKYYFHKNNVALLKSQKDCEVTLYFLNIK